MQVQANQPSSWILIIHFIFYIQAEQQGLQKEYTETTEELQLCWIMLWNISTIYIKEMVFFVPVI